MSTFFKKSYQKIKQNEGYNILISETRVQERAAKRMVIEGIVEDNTTEIPYEMKDSNGKKVKRQMTIIPKLSEIRIWKSSLVYVPQWNIKFEAKNINYNRIITPASGTKIVDEIALCPMHFSRWKVWSRPKQVYAVCDICGKAVVKNTLCKSIVSTFVWNIPKQDRHRLFSVQAMEILNWRMFSIFFLISLYHSLISISLGRS